MCSMDAQLSFQSIDFPSGQKKSADTISACSGSTVRWKFGFMKMMPFLESYPLQVYESLFLPLLCTAVHTLDFLSVLHMWGAKTIHGWGRFWRLFLAQGGLVEWTLWVSILLPTKYIYFGKMNSKLPFYLVSLEF